MTADPQRLCDLESGTLRGATRLQLRAALTEFPSAIFNLADSLEILDLSHNQLSTLPDDLPRLKRLRVLFCSYNHFTELPEILGACPQLQMIGFRANRISQVSARSLPLHSLRWLILTENAITTLPATLGQAQQLQKLMLAGNQLHDWPPANSHWPRLELLRISANHYHHLPPVLLEQPQLRWLAYTGNPLSEPANQELPVQDLPLISWTDVQLGEVLGQGASGTTYQALYQAPGLNATQVVAVKLFHHALNSDGLAVSEIEANGRAGLHPNLVGAIGQVVDHPQGKMGLVMPILPGHLQVLAHPPSFDSCTRDIYPPNVVLNVEAVMHIARGVGQAMRHLHARGLLHGDLYAHNVLWDNTHVVLTDLGGASPLPQHPMQRQALMALDQRALATLCDELAQLAALNPTQQQQLQHVAGLV